MCRTGKVDAAVYTIVKDEANFDGYDIDDHLVPVEEVEEEE
jgi:hypothetical protein